MFPNYLILATINLCNISGHWTPKRQILLNYTLQQSIKDYELTILTLTIPSSWSLKNTMSPTENSILQRVSIDVLSAPLPLSDICSSCPLVLLSAGQSVCVRVCLWTRWGGVGCEVRVGRVVTPPPLEGSGPHTCGTSHSSMANSH